MHFLVEMPEKGKKNVFREKKKTTNKIALLFLDAEVIPEI